MAYYDETVATSSDAQRQRWDAEGERFWRLDSWTDAELADEQRFSHYLAGQHIRKAGAASWKHGGGSGGRTRG